MPLTLGEGVVGEKYGNGDDSTTAYRPYATETEGEVAVSLATRALVTRPVHAALDLAQPALEGVNTLTVAYANAARAARATHPADRPYANLEQMHFGSLGPQNPNPSLDSDSNGNNNNLNNDLYGANDANVVGEHGSGDGGEEGEVIRVLRHLEGRIEGHTGFKPGLRDTVSISTAEYARWQYDHAHNAVAASSAKQRNARREEKTAARLAAREERHRLIAKMAADAPEWVAAVEAAAEAAEKPREVVQTRGRIAGCTKYVAGKEEVLGVSDAKIATQWYANTFIQSLQ